ncbi:PEP-CTERM sorting domain-containing protein [Adhaeretor mobilis]|uniref:PEP-CTERM protein-sorting domain-containing protein n=1 Tax=Adhaeretor mobilis TaxID=1930276 RepID=A0A517MYE3_9BACT|nr:PEP-CTERM sorting domain-containing protein [Adhaeretor mobilis]QDS99904.1 hypothetical protein HG15A2_32350 [Adhaeretor mobilis]
MKRLLSTALLCLVTSFASQASAQVNVGVDASDPWLGFMNVFELPENGGGYVFGDAWGVPDLVAEFTGDDLRLSPNVINDPNEFWYQNTTGTAPDPSNPGGPGQRGNKNMAASMYIQDDSLLGENVIFSGNVNAHSFTSAHTTTAFIKEFDGAFNLLFSSTMELTTAGAFTISLEIDDIPGNHVQYGFETVGENVWSTDVAPFGSISIDAVAAPPTPSFGSYSQNFESVGLAGTDPTALASGSEGDIQPGSDGKHGWSTFVNVFDGSDNYKFGYGTNPAPNEDPPAGFSQVVAGQGAGGATDQYLNAFSDYGCCDLAEPTQQGHGNGTDMVQTNLFQEYEVGSDDVGRAIEFSFDIKLPGGDQAANALGASGSATAEMFIKTLDPNDFSETGRTDVDILTGIAGLNDATWTNHTLNFAITSDMVGDVFQFGIESTASNFDPTGVFLDNLNMGDASSANADFNGDLIVNGEDFLTWQENEGSTGALADGDADGNGTINGLDLAVWQAQYGPVPQATASIAGVPEPASAALVLLGMVCLGGTRRRVR